MATLLLGKAAERETIELKMKPFSSHPDGSIFTARRPSVKSIWTFIGAFRKTPADLLFMLMMAGVTLNVFC
jgi:hypothetical protein